MVDEERIAEIIDGGETNALQNQGVLIQDPDIVVQGEVDGDRGNMIFGIHGNLGEDHLDYLLHREWGVTLGEKEDFYDEHDVKVYVYYFEDGDTEYGALKRQTYFPRTSGDGWRKFTTATLRESTDDVPEDVRYDTWINVGDMNPREHGGIFVKWSGNRWDMISTRKMQEERQEDIGEKYMGMIMSFSPIDIWKNPKDLSEGLEEHIKDRLGVLGMEDVDPTEADRIVTGLAQIPLEFNARDFYFSNYWEEMNGRGIYKETVT